MSSEEEIEKTLGNDSESFHESEKRSKVCYSRDFLISLKDLDVCKELPSGFDQSLLSEFEDGYHGAQDRLRNPGSLPLQSHRRTDYSSSPPTRGDSSNYSRGVYGRWDNRSSVKSDKDSDSQSDKDSDAGRPQGNQSRKPWQSSEHDGLLGSGSFARPPGYPAGVSGPKGRSNDQYQLKKSNEPYHPPRPYKAGPISRREMTDSLNDETFGSAECGSQDRAEEERRRREAFELMRKEQHKSLQEKQNSTSDKLKKNHVRDFEELVGDSDIGNKAFGKLTELDESMKHSVSNNDSSKPSLQTSVVRPLVPPGFKSTVVEKNSSTTTLAHSRALEAGRPDVESISHAKPIVQNSIFDTQEDRQNFSTNIDIFDEKHSADNKIYRDASISLESETQGIGQIVKGGTKKLTGHNLVDPSTQAQQPSILDKLFNSVLSDNLSGSSGIVEKQDIKQDDPWNPPNVIQSSKFAQWFLEDEKKGTEDQSHVKPDNLFSLFGGSEKGGSQASDVKTPRHIPSEFIIPSSEISDGRLTSDIISAPVGLPKKSLKSSKEATPPPILTCEDLEQTILSGFSESNSASQKTVEGQNFSGPEKLKAETDSQASQHLLSLLKKGPLFKDVETSVTESGFSEKKVENVGQSGNSLTLETLFGSAFMKELQSAEAPVSALGSAVKSNIIGPVSNNDNFAGWFRDNDTQVEQRSDILSKHGGFDGGDDIQLPEEESLIGVGNSVFNPFGNSIDRESQSSNRPMDISDKLAALGTGFKDERPIMRGPHGPLDHEIPFHNLQAQSSSPRFHPGPQMNQARPLFHSLDSHPTHASPPMSFNSQEGMFQRGGPMMRPPFRHPSGGQAGFDPSHPMMQQMQMQMQMQRPMPNNLSHRLQEFNRGAQVPPHLRSRAAGPMQEHNPMQGFPFDQQQANFGGLGMSMQAPNHPEAFQRLIEMEMRANSSKRIMHPFDSFGNNNNNQSGLHPHDLDTSFRYR